MSKLRRVLAMGACLASTAMGQGCEKKQAPAAVEPAHGLPPLDPSAANAQPRAEHPRTDTPTAPEPHGAPHAAMNPHGDPHGGGPPGGASMEALAPGDIPFDKNTVIAGQLKLDGKLKDKVQKGDVIYLVVRSVGEAGAPGMVLAVKRLEAAAFPMPFQLDSRNAMVVGTQLKPPVVLNVRVDKDGDAMTKNPGDVTGTVTVKALPADKLALTLDTVL